MQLNNSRILVIDDNEDVLLAAKLLLKPITGYVLTENDPERIPELLCQNSFDIIFLDMNFSKDMTSGQEGFYWLNKILNINSDSIVILITAYGDVETAVKAVKEGATDFILKPWQNEKLIATLSSSLKLRESKLELDKIKNKESYLNREQNSSFPEIIGVSDGIKNVFKTIEKVAPTPANVLILGENGTGKEVVARTLHKLSDRSDQSFISVDMGAVSQSLFESELFGHVKGSFTDAKEDRPGRFELADKGTLFLDEIGNLPVELQAKLLKVIQNRVVTRLGSNKEIPFDTRLICATNMPIHEMADENKFRQDLLYRINTVEIKLPPLRDRREDIPLLAEYFLKNIKTKYKKTSIELTSNAIKNLRQYDWPGNVRELQHSIERAVILCESDNLTSEDFYFKPSKEIENSIELETFKLDDVEKNIIQKVLIKYSGNVTKAAKELGLTRTSLYRRMEKYEL